MAVLKTAQWWIRVSGNKLNGGGYDASISGATTNYADQDSAQLTFTDLACANNTTLTSAAQTFTSAMIGNCVRIASGTNFTAGYYFVTGYTDAHTVTIDRNPTSGANASAGVGRLGGAWALIIENIPASTSGGTLPTITTPVIAGNTVNIRGDGTSDPTTNGYTEVPDGIYYVLPAGDETSGLIRFLGYNGRPRIVCAGMFYASTRLLLDHLKCEKNVTSSSYPNYSVFDGIVFARDTIFEANGNDTTAMSSCLGAIGNWFKNTGSTSAGTAYALTIGSYGATIMNNYFQKWRGGGVNTGSTSMTNIRNNIFDSLCGTSTAAIYTAEVYTDSIVGNSIYNGAGNGIEIGAALSAVDTPIINNIITNHTGSGKFAIKTGLAAADVALATFIIGYNALYNNNGNYSGLNTPTTDIALSGDPFTNAASQDFNLNNTAGAGAACRAASLPFFTL